MARRLVRDIGATSKRIELLGDAETFGKALGSQGPRPTYVGKAADRVGLTPPCPSLSHSTAVREKPVTDDPQTINKELDVAQAIGLIHQLRASADILGGSPDTRRLASDRLVRFLEDYDAVIGRLAQIVERQAATIRQKLDALEPLRTPVGEPDDSEASFRSRATVRRRTCATAYQSDVADTMTPMVKLPTTQNLDCYDFSHNTDPNWGYYFYCGTGRNATPPLTASCPKAR